MPSKRATLVILFAELVVIYIVSTAPTPLYVMYREAFGFSQIVLTLIYAIYVVGSVLTMFFLGRLSDEIGRRPVVLASLVIAAISTIVFLLAKSTAWLFPARVICGFAVALSSGASMAWIIELDPRKDRATSTQIAIVANFIGLAFGPALAGVLAQFAPLRLRLIYWVCLGLVLVVSFFVWRACETIQNPKSIFEVSLRPRLGVPQDLRKQFVAPAVGAFAIFAVLGFYTALIPSLLIRALHIKNHAIAGGIVGELFILGALSVALTPRLKSRTGLLTSLSLLLPSIALLLLSEFFSSILLLMIAAGVGGIATGLGYHYTLTLVNDLSPDDKRSEVISTYLIAAYCGISLPVVGVGILSQLVSPEIGHLVFAGVIALLDAIAMLVGTTQLRDI